MARNLLGDKAIEGAEADPARCREYAESSPAIVTPLNRHLGYEEAASIAKQSLVERRTIREVVLERGHVADGTLTVEQLDDVLDVQDVLDMTRPAGGGALRHPGGLPGGCCLVDCGSVRLSNTNQAFRRRLMRPRARGTTTVAVGALLAIPFALLLAAAVGMSVLVGFDGGERQTSACGLQPAGNSTLVAPMAPGSFRLTSDFGERRDPLTGVAEGHRGQDFGAPSGTPIYAAAAGTVVRAGPAGGFGQWIVIDHQVGGQLVSTVMLSAFSLTWSSLVVLAAALGVYVLYLLAMAGFLAICGVPREEIAKWALKQAGRQRLTDLIWAARGLPAGAGTPKDHGDP